MPKHRLLMTTLLASLTFSHVTLAANQNEAPNAKSSNDAATPKANTNEQNPALRKSVETMLTHVNEARIALILKDNEAAKKHIGEARRVLGTLKAASGEEIRSPFASSRLTYDTAPSNYKYYYVPVDIGPVEVKTLEEGPFWTRKGLAVTDAEIVYLTLNVKGDKAETYLQDASDAVGRNEFGEAQRVLGAFIDAVIKVDEERALPFEKARDNITLARYFIKQKNYDGARYSLSHADKALDAAEKDENYKQRRTSIAVMRKEINTLQENIRRNDPTLLERADTQLQRWWEDLKSWAER